MGTKVDLSGKKFGKLTVLCEAGRSNHGKVLWECLCDCGKTKTFISGNLISGLSSSCGICCKTPNILNEKFENVTVIRQVGLNGVSNDKNAMFWECVDDRGFKKIMRTTDFIRKSRTKINLPKENKDIVVRRVFSKYKYDAKSHKRLFSLTYEKFYELVNANCEYCGAKPKMYRKSNSGHKTFPLNGVDRIDSSLGYSEGNVKSCCYPCNRAKSNMDFDEFIEYLNNLVEFRKDK